MYVVCGLCRVCFEDCVGHNQNLCHSPSKDVMYVACGLCRISAVLPAKM